MNKIVFIFSCCCLMLGVMGVLGVSCIVIFGGRGDKNLQIVLSLIVCCLLFYLGIQVTKIHVLADIRQELREMNARSQSKEEQQ